MRPLHNTTLGSFFTCQYKQLAVVTNTNTVQIIEYDVSTRHNKETYYCNQETVKSTVVNRSDCIILVYLLIDISRAPKKGAATTLYAAVHPDLNKEEFQYYSDCKATPPSTASRYVLICASTNNSCKVFSHACGHVRMCTQCVFWHSIVLISYNRNVTHQEQLWDRSCDLLKDYLSPEIWREYGPSQAPSGGEGQQDQPPPVPSGGEGQQDQPTPVPSVQ